MRATLATCEAYEGSRRKLVWFDRTPTGVYFGIPSFLLGSHTSYHRDGNIFRTSPATGQKPTFIGNHLNLKEFRGWYQLGIAAVTKDELRQNPPVKGRDRSPANILFHVALDDYPSATMNFVIELITPEDAGLLHVASVAPPKDATVYVLKLGSPWVVVTVLGHQHNLLIRPNKDGFTVSHFNSRYSANRAGIEYRYEVAARSHRKRGGSW